MSRLSIIERSRVLYHREIRVAVIFEAMPQHRLGAFTGGDDGQGLVAGIAAAGSVVTTIQRTIVVAWSALTS